MKNEIASPLLSEKLAIGSDNGPSTLGTQNKKKKLGILFGVVIPACGSLFGVVVFLRLGFCVGYAGVIGSIAMYVIAAVVASLTTLSLGALSSNGYTGAGGIYTLTSRSTTPAAGGTVGVLYFVGQTVGAAFYATAFADVTIDIFLPDYDQYGYRVLVATLFLILLTVLALNDAKSFARLTGIVLIVVFFSVISLLLSCFITDIADRPDWYTGPSEATFKTNTGSHFHATDGVSGSEGGSESGDTRQTFWSVFAVIFPSVSGFIAGSNLSGDLKDPGRTIAPGTIYALYTALLVYIAIIFGYASSVEDSELRSNLFVSMDVAYNQYAVAVGVWAATSMSGLGHLVGAAKIMHALAKDKLLPSLNAFAYSSPSNDSPQMAVLLTYSIAQCAILIGNLNIVAGIITNFYLLTYFFTNLSCFVLKITGAPNFRPEFKYFSWHTALTGAIMCIVLMFLAEPIYAGVSVFLSIILFLYIMYQYPVTPWGDVRQALIFHQVRKYLLRLDTRLDHPKFWRPSILLILNESACNYPLALIDFCNHLKKGGMFVIGDVLIGTPVDCFKELEAMQGKMASLLDHLNVGGIKAFSQVSLSSDWLDGARNLISCGLGGMRPNTVCFALPELDDDDDDVTEKKSLMKEYNIKFKTRVSPEVAVRRFVYNLFGCTSSSSSEESDNRKLIKDNKTDVETNGTESKSDFICLETKQSCETLDEIGIIKSMCKQELSKRTRLEENTESASRRVFEAMCDCLRLKKNVVICSGFSWGCSSRQEIQRRFQANSSQRLNIDIYVNMLHLKSSKPTDECYSTNVDFIARRIQSASPDSTLTDEYDEDLDDPAAAPHIDVNPIIALQLQLAHVLRLGDTWNECCQLRTIILVPTSDGTCDAVDILKRQAERLLSLIRIESQVIVTSVAPCLQTDTGSNISPHIHHLHDLLLENSPSSSSCLVFCSLPRLDNVDPTDYMRNINYLTSDLHIGSVLSYPWSSSRFHVEDGAMTGKSFVTTAL